MSINTAEDLLEIWHQIRAGPVDPLIHERTIQRTTRRVKLLRLFTHILTNRNSTANGSFARLQHREHTGRILGLELFTLKLIIINQLEFEGASEDLSDYLNHVHEVRARSFTRNVHFS